MAAVLIIAGWATGAVQSWATSTLAVVWIGTATVMASNWRRTGRVLVMSLTVFVAWAVLSLLGR